MRTKAHVGSTAHGRGSPQPPFDAHVAHTISGRLILEITSKEQ